MDDNDNTDNTNNNTDNTDNTDNTNNNTTDDSFLLKLLKLSSELVVNEHVTEMERTHVLRIMQTAIDILEHTDTDDYTDDLDFLHPVSFLNMSIVPYFICKSWVRTSK